MKSIFDKLEDKTPPSVGKEIGAALSTAVTEIAKNNESYNEKILQSIAYALQSREHAQPVKKWTFTVVRDNDKLLDKIIAEAS